MLRKRTSFKPNLKQAANASTPSQSSNTDSTPLVHAGSLPKDATRVTEASPIIQSTSENSSNIHEQLQPSTSSQQNNSKTTNEPSLYQSISTSDPISDCSLITTNKQNDLCSSAEPIPPGSVQQKQTSQDEVSNQRVQEAITQLTGQKFEPIKSLSLRSSANKNVKLKDLLFFNPPMTKDQKRHKKSVYLAKKNERKKVQEEQASVSKEVQSDSSQSEKSSSQTAPTLPDNPEITPQEQSLVPKVKMGPEGKLILDESSMIINRKNSVKEQEAIVEDNEDVICRTNYDSFRRKPSTTSQAKWSFDDTKKFYHALTLLGTDFSMMESLLFSGLRSRTELHKKFKREERVNKLKVDIALSNRISLNSEELDELKEIFFN